MDTSPGCRAGDDGKGAGRYSRSIRKLPGGARIFTLIRKAGYVGVRIVTSDPMPFVEATADLDGRQRLLADLPLAGSYVYAGGDEWVVVTCRRSMQEVTCHLCAGMFG